VASDTKSLADQRVFRSLAFLPERELSLPSMIDRLEPHFDRPKALPSAELATLLHARYVSPKQYTASPLLSSISLVRNRKRAYAYDTYILAARVAETPVLVVTVPFASMWTDVFPLVQTALTSGTSRFFYVNLNALVHAVRENRGGLNNLRLSRYEAIITGDAKLRSIVLAGKDAVRSPTLEHLSASDTIQLIPKSCAFAYADSRIRMSLETDRYGNFAPYVSAGAQSLLGLPTLFELLFAEGLIGTSWTFPPSREEPSSEPSAV
jgi:hypothetical protein